MTSCKCYPNFIQIFWKTRFILIFLNVNSKTSNVRSSNKVPSLPQQPQLAFLKSKFWNWDLLLQLLLQLPLRLLWMILSKAIETGIILLIKDMKSMNVFWKKVPDQTGIGIFCHCAAPDWFFMSRFRELVTMGQKSRTFVHFTWISAATRVFYVCFSFCLLAHLIHDLSQVEKKPVVTNWVTGKLTTIFTQNDNFNNFEWNSCQLLITLIFFSA